jgi:hypothetical protein
MNYLPAQVLGRWFHLDLYSRKIVGAEVRAIRPEVGKEGFTYSHSLGRRHLQALSR